MKTGLTKTRRGWNVEHIIDCSAVALYPWEFQHHLISSSRDNKKSGFNVLIYGENDKHFFVRDHEHPYIGGRPLTWSRQCYRLSNLNFEANFKDGMAVEKEKVVKSGAVSSAKNRPQLLT